MSKEGKELHYEVWPIQGSFEMLTRVPSIRGIVEVIPVLHQMLSPSELGSLVIKCFGLFHNFFCKLLFFLVLTDIV